MSSARALVLLSGGLDSATTLAFAKARGYAPTALSFSYGQRHEVEIAAARKVAAHLGVDAHYEVPIDLRPLGGSALTSRELAVPKDRPLSGSPLEIPITYVPARNTIFLSIALAYAEVMRAAHIFLGVNALDYSGYPDCRPEFVAAFQRLANLATRNGVLGNPSMEIHAPLIAMTKAEIIRLGLSLGVDYGLTISCYDPDPLSKPCNRCDSCQLRARGFAEAGTSDPALTP